MTRIILFGVPGSGKGTQARRLEHRFGYCHISTGDLIRAEIAAETPLGLKMKPILEKGGYIDDSVMIEMVQHRVDRPDVSSGYVLDGFPRTLNQARGLSRLAVTREISILLDIADEETAIKRILSRISCGSCGAVFNLDVNPPREKDICDQCGEKLVRRADDTENALRKRFRVYREQTLPMLDYYQGLGELRRVDASMAMDRVSTAIEEIVS